MPAHRSSSASPKRPAAAVIGVISDTHGLLRPEAVAALRGVDRIVHAGDVGRPEILESLGVIAPVTAVRGNVDHGAWAMELPLTERIAIGGVEILVLHDLATLDRTEVDGARVIVSGHSHRPSIREQDGVLYLNPGAAGPRRFRLPVTLALLRVVRGAPSAEIVRLALEAPGA